MDIKIRFIKRPYYYLVLRACKDMRLDEKQIKEYLKEEIMNNFLQMFEIKV